MAEIVDILFTMILKLKIISVFPDVYREQGIKPLLDRRFMIFKNEYVHFSGHIRNEVSIS